MTFWFWVTLQAIEFKKLPICIYLVAASLVASRNISIVQRGRKNIGNILRFTKRDHQNKLWVDEPLVSKCCGKHQSSSECAYESGKYVWGSRTARMEKHTKKPCWGNAVTNLRVAFHLSCGLGKPHWRWRP